MVVQETPFLPDIISGVSGRVNAVTTAYPLESDRFSVGFKHGLYSQVGKDLKAEDNDADVIIWLVMNFMEDIGKDVSIFADVRLNVVIFTSTDAKYSQAERDELIFKPKLIPAYNEFIKQVNADKNIEKVMPNKRVHTRILRPYWGGGDVNGADSKNLFKKNVDAIQINGLQLRLAKYRKCP